MCDRNIQYAMKHVMKHAMKHAMNELTVGLHQKCVFLTPQLTVERIISFFWNIPEGPAVA